MAVMQEREWLGKIAFRFVLTTRIYRYLQSTCWDSSQEVVVDLGIFFILLMEVHGISEIFGLSCLECGSVDEASFFSKVS